ncbi:ATP-binding cassette domain-containing protein [Peptoniphilaceae bacterium SGI.131]
MLRLRNIYKSYGEKHIFKDFSCDIEEEKINYIVGKSGIGKTCLLRIIMGLEPCQGDLSDFSGKIFSVCFQDNILFDYLTVYENIKMVYPGIFRESLIEDLRAVELANVIDKPVGQLSGGMKRRVAILRALIFPADIYIFDEAFREIDKKSYENMLKYFKIKMRGKTVIMTSHNEKEVELLADNIVKIEEDE